MAWPPKHVPKKFPLTPYPGGWCKHIPGKGTRHVCGKIPHEEALERWHERRDELMKGVKPARRRRPDEGITVKLLANAFMTRQLIRLETGSPRKMRRRTFEDYRLTIQAFTDHVGASRYVSELGPDEFADYLANVPGKSPSTRARHVAYISAMFAWARKSDRLPSTINFGPDFIKPAREERRSARQQKVKVFSQLEILWLLLSVPPAVEPLILLGINCGMTAADIGEMPRDVVDLDNAVIDYARAKVGTSIRRCPLWKETVDSLREYSRPAARDPADDGLFFLTRLGRPWQREKPRAGKGKGFVPINTLSQRFARLEKACGVPHKPGRNHSGLRATFATIADATGDERARDTVMGHRSRHLAHISAEYVEVPDERLIKVSDHVRLWLFNHP